MSLLRCFSRFIRFSGWTGMLLVSTADVRALMIDPEAPREDGAAPCVAIVAGRPAIAWAEKESQAVKFVRAEDESGTVWGRPVTVDTVLNVELHMSLLIVNGNPAVCYSDVRTGKLMYSRAADPAGSAWGPPVIIDTVNSLDTGGTLEIIDGHPAVCYTGYNLEVRYARATDAGGTSWGQGTIVDASGEFHHPSLKNVQGRPAIAYGGELTGLWYVRASDAAGTAWQAPVPVAAQGNHACMQIVNGRPAISYRNQWGEVAYARAANPEGTSWNPPAAVDIRDDTGAFTSLAVVNGKPAIAYYSSDPYYDLKYVQAIDSDGDTTSAWGKWVNVDSAGDVGAAASLLEVNGLPAIACQDTTRGHVKFVRAVTVATEASGQWPPQLMFYATGQPDPFDTEVVRSFGNVAVGDYSVLYFSLVNPNSGSADLLISSITLEGPDAAEFSIAAGGGPATVAAGFSVVIAVRYSPVTRGFKSAVLHITSNGETVPDYAIRLAGISAPDIGVAWPGVATAVDGGTATLPVTDPGSVASLEFTVGNIGAGPLEGLAVTIDGPDSSEFSLSSLPAPAVPPLNTTTFTLRHAPLSPGRKTAVLHIASNVPGSKNPFDITVRTIPGSRDSAFSFTGPAPSAIALRADGRILAGTFGTVECLNPDGTPDPTFFAPPVNDGNVFCLAVQKDGKILLGGEFQRVYGRPRPGLARLLPDGSLDESFAPPLTLNLRSLAIQPDGKILAGSTFSPEQGGTAPPLYRLHADGTIDTGFQARPNHRVDCLALQTDGRILAGGFFTAISSHPAFGIARLNPDGTPDSFAAKFGGNVFSLAVQPDGRILAGGTFAGGLARLFPDGTTDPSLHLPLENSVHGLALQADGKCFASFTLFGFLQTPERVIRRIAADGSLDDGFLHPGVEGMNQVFGGDMALQADGRPLLSQAELLLGGSQDRNFIRLTNDPAFTLLKTEGRSTIHWFRGGTAPEVSDVTFDVKPAGAAGWTLLGTAHRIPGGWELSGLTLPASGEIRAQGYAGGSVIEETVPILTALEYWRLQYFNTSANTGDAADNADPDHDGLTNFTEFAFGLNPVDRASNALPGFKHDGTHFTATLTAPDGRGDILYRAESSPSLQPGTWTAIPDTGSGSVHTFRTPATASRLFIRWNLSLLP